MKTLKRLTLMMVALLVSATIAFAQKPNIHILATGGTIAGAGGSSTATNYTAGQMAIATLLEAVPELQDMGVPVFEATDIDADSFFEDAEEKEKKKKTITCPHCGEEIEV